jgi:hypothetical protein
MTQNNMARQNLIDSRYLSLVLLIVVVQICLRPRILVAERIWIEPKPATANQSDWYPKAIESIVADVVRFNANQLTVIIRGDDSETSLPAVRVIWIEPQQRSPVEVEFIRQFNDGQYSESLEMLPKVLETRPPIWRQQRITMMAAVAALRCDRCKIALELVSQLDRRSLPPVVIAWLPIQWTNRRTNSGAVAAATARLDDSSPLVQLVAASLLLSSSNRSAAVASLKSLERSQRPEVRALSAVLQWRTATPPQVVELANVWQDRVDRMPMVWQTGPTKTLTDKLQSAGLGDRAKPLQWSGQLTPIHPHP